MKLFDMLVLKYTQRRCNHPDYKVLRSRVLGVTLDWGMMPTPHYEFEYQCKNCGKVWREKKIKWGDPWPRDKDGWPIDTDTGGKMRIDEGEYDD